MTDNNVPMSQSAHNLKSKLPYYGPYGELNNIDFTKDPVNTLEIHQVANTLHEYDITDLVESIKSQGQIDSILVWKNPKTRRLMVVNGRHRMWACNVIGIKVKTMVLTCKEVELPRTILDQQLLSRGTDRVFATITIMEYLEQHPTITQASLLSSYTTVIASRRDISYAKKIRELMPLWITTLKLGKGVKLPNSGYTEVKSLRAIAEACKQMDKEASSTPILQEPAEASPEGIATAKLIKALTAVLEGADSVLSNEHKRYALKQLTSNELI